MTLEEFDATGWTPNMICEYQEEEYAIASVDFQERLIFMRDECGTEFVARCENVTNLRRKK